MILTGPRTAPRTAVRTAAAIVTAMAIMVRGWVRCTQAAKMLGYDRKTVRNMCIRGDIPSHLWHRAGHEYRIARVWIDEQLRPRGVIRRPPK